jgi:imidazolonepropionase-like amidohydrolase
MPGLLPQIDPDGLLEFSVVYTDRALNHMSKRFGGVMTDISRMLKSVYGAHSVALVPGSGTTETSAELGAIVSTAHRLNRKVATHSSGLSGANLLAIAAGTDTLEHGPVNDADIAAMVSHGTAFTPTLLASKIAGESGALGAPMDLLTAATESARKAHAAGVPLLFGSDVPVPPLDGTAQEFLLLASAGLRPAEVLATATTNAAKALGMEAQLGTLAPGKFADAVAFATNPLKDLKALASPVFVMQEGKVVRNDAVKH